MLLGSEAHRKKKAEQLLRRVVRTIDRFEEKPFDLLPRKTDKKTITSASVLARAEIYIRFIERLKDVTENGISKRKKSFEQKYAELVRRISHLEKITKNIEA